MNNTTILTSLYDTKELKNLILSNPELPLIIFAGEEAYNGECSYEMAEVTSVEIAELTLYKDYYMGKEDFKDQLIDDLSAEEEYKELSDLEYIRMIYKKVEEREFIKAIVIYVG